MSDLMTTQEIEPGMFVVRKSNAAVEMVLYSGSTFGIGPGSPTGTGKREDLEDIGAVYHVKQIQLPFVVVEQLSQYDHKRRPQVLDLRRCELEQVSGCLALAVVGEATWETLGYGGNSQPEQPESPGD